MKANRENIPPVANKNSNTKSCIISNAFSKAVSPTQINQRDKSTNRSLEKVGETSSMNAFQNKISAAHSSSKSTFELKQQSSLNQSSHVDPQLAKHWTDFIRMQAERKAPSVPLANKNSISQTIVGMKSSHRFNSGLPNITSDPIRKHHVLPVSSNSSSFKTPSELVHVVTGGANVLTRVVVDSSTTSTSSSEVSRRGVPVVTDGVPPRVVVDSSTTSTSSSEVSPRGVPVVTDGVPPRVVIDSSTTSTSSSEVSRRGVPVVTDGVPPRVVIDSSTTSTSSSEVSPRGVPVVTDGANVLTRVVVDSSTTSTSSSEVSPRGVPVVTGGANIPTRVVAADETGFDEDEIDGETGSSIDYYSVDQKQSISDYAKLDGIISRRLDKASRNVTNSDSKNAVSM
jgi:hypothetical protein